ncbi:MAG: hypothetical protein IJ734_10255 [Fibrobacter sp.]|nr:hypothetical protein [Fibrobacter sp.]
MRQEQCYSSYVVYSYAAFSSSFVSVGKSTTVVSGDSVVFFPFPLRSFRCTFFWSMWLFTALMNWMLPSSLSRVALPIASVVTIPNPSRQRSRYALLASATFEAISLLRFCTAVRYSLCLLSRFSSQGLNPQALNLSSPISLRVLMRFVKVPVDWS